MLNFQLFRIKVFPSKQKDLFIKSKTPSEILKETINALPEAELRKGTIWHIGNLSKINNNGLYFRVGKTTKSKIEIYQAGNFADEEFETAPYTHVILDVPLEVCAIAQKTKLTPKTSGIAKRLSRLLNESKYAQSVEATFTISAINDPDDFITHLQRAYAISKFWITFSMPNHFDANEDFVKPMQALIKETEGKKGKVEINGTNLDAGSLEDLTRTAASAGEEAAARITYDVLQPKVTKRLSGNPVSISHDSIEDGDQKRSLLNKLISLYKNIRGNNE